MSIEFRWQECSVWDIRPIVTVNDRPSVLQYRVLGPHLIEQDNFGRVTKQWREWSPWQDVPAVAADSGRKDG